MERRARPPMPMGCPEMTRVPGMYGTLPCSAVCMGAAGLWMYLYACTAHPLLSTMRSKCAQQACIKRDTLRVLAGTASLYLKSQQSIFGSWY